jgi:hypothetical protein
MLLLGHPENILAAYAPELVRCQIQRAEIRVVVESRKNLVGKDYLLTV